MTVDNLDERVGVAMHQLPVETLAAIRRGGHTATSLIGQTADLPVPLCIRNIATAVYTLTAVGAEARLLAEDRSHGLVRT